MEDYIVNRIQDIFDLALSVGGDITENFDTTTAMGKFVFHMFCALIQ